MIKGPRVPPWSHSGRDPHPPRPARHPLPHCGERGWHKAAAKPLSRTAGEGGPNPQGLVGEGGAILLARRGGRGLAMTELPSFSVAGQVALVTGASSGIGRHFAALLAAAGAKVVLAARRVDRLAELAREIEAAGGQSLPIACDVTRSDEVAAAVATAETELGALSILVNNAGVVVSKPLFEHTEADWDHVVDTNLKGAWLMAREFAQHLVGLKRPGRIINITSVLGFRTIGRVPAYCAAKAGLTHLPRYWRWNWRGTASSSMRWRRAMSRRISTALSFRPRPARR